MADFHFPSSLDEACALLSQHGGEARVIAGGVALMLLVRHQLFFPNQLISLKRVPGLGEIRFDETSGLSIGALATHHQVESSLIVREKYPVLAQCLHHVGNLRVRNMGTVLGDLCHGDNHSDPAPLLNTLGAQIKARSVRGERLIPMASFHQDVYQTSLQEDEIATEIVIPPLAPQAHTAYLRFSGNSPIDWPVLGAAGLLVQEDGLCKELRLSLGSLTGVPMSFDEEAKELAGKKLTPASIKRFARSCAARLDPIEDAQGSAWYKKRLAEVYIKRTVEGLARARKKD